MLTTSLKSLPEVDAANWLPAVPHWGNFRDVFDYDNPDLNQRGVPLARFLFNSLFVAAWVTFLQVLTSALAAFSFARLKWPGRDKVFLLYLSTMMLPGLVMMIPNFQVMIELRLVDTLPGLVIPAAFSAFGTFLLRQFMLTIPASLDEAAEIDGAGKFRLFWDVILPLSRPGLITLTIFTFKGNYNSFFWPLVMVKSEARYTLPVGLLAFDSSRGQSTHLLMAAVTLSVLPLILLFVCFPKIPRPRHPTRRGQGLTRLPPLPGQARSLQAAGLRTPGTRRSGRLLPRRVRRPQLRARCVGPGSATSAPPPPYTDERRRAATRTPGRCPRRSRAIDAVSFHPTPIARSIGDPRPCRRINSPRQQANTRPPANSSTTPVRRHRRRLGKPRRAQPPRHPRHQRQPEQQVQVRPQHAAADLGR